MEGPTIKTAHFYLDLALIFSQKRKNTMIGHIEKSQNTYTTPSTSLFLISVQSLTQACLSLSPPPPPLLFLFLTLPRSPRESSSSSVHLPLVSVSQYKGNVLLFSIKYIGISLWTSTKEKQCVKSYFQKLSSA